MAPCKSEPKMKEFPWEGPNFKANLPKFQRVGKKMSKTYGISMGGSTMEEKFQRIG
jgi:hypothetical protein